MSEQDIKIQAVVDLLQVTLGAEIETSKADMIVKDCIGILESIPKG